MKNAQHSSLKRIVLFASIFFSFSGLAQTGTQSRLWSVPPKEVTFPTLTTPPLPISGSGFDGIATSNFANNAMHDPNGNLLFFINDGIVYDRNGVLIGQITTQANGFINGTAEWTIVPVPGGCTKYYLIGGFYDFSSPLAAGAFPQPYYIILDLSLINNTTNAHGDFIGADVNNNPLPGSNVAFPLIDPLLQSSQGYTLAISHASNMHFAVTPLRAPSILYPDPNGSRFLYVNNLIGGLIDRFLITSTGISYETNFLFNGGNTALFGSARAEMEIVKISNISDPHFGNYRLALPYQTDGAYAANNRVLVLDLDFATGNIIPSIPAFPNPKYIDLPNFTDPSGNFNRAQAHGIEFSADGEYLYVTHTQPPYLEYAFLSVITPAFSRLDLQTAPNITDASDFQYSQIEMGNDGKLYFAGNNAALNHARLGSLNINFNNSPVLAQWNDNAIPNVSVPISTASFDIFNASGQPSQDVYRIRLLNDQVDGEIYQNIPTSSPVSSCCTLNTSFTKDYYTAGTQGSPNYTNYTNLSQTWTPTNNPFGGSSSNPVSTVTIRNTLDIPLGFTIRISGMTFQFAPRITTPVPDQVAGGRVIVERGIASPFKKGGTLILDNSTFTSYDGCGNGMWEGIEVRGFGGNSPVTQGTNFNNSVQGWLSVLNNSVISNAYIGAIAARYATSFPLSISYDMTQTGGVIQAVSSTFKNNQCGVVFMTFSEPTNPLHNRSFFTKCNFQTTSFLLNDNASQFQFFVDMYGTNGIIFKGNNFENSRPVISNTDITHNGLGIFSYNAGFSVVPFCITYNCTGFTKNTFKNLAYGIQVWSSNSITPVKIDQTDFTGNFRGIFLNYLNYSTITTNTFKVLEYSNSQPLTSSYGLYLNGCSGYQVEGNDFAYSFSPPTNPTTDGTYGIIVSNSGDNNNLIYRNTFHQIYIGIQAQRKNCEVTIANLNTSNPVNDQGLKMKCNSFDANAIGDYDIVEPNGCIDYHQGDFNPVNLSASANNCFDNSGTHINYYLDPQTTQTDPYTGYPYGVIPIHYVYPTGSCYLPLQYTTNKIGLTPSLVGSLCTSQITGCAYCPQAKIASAVQQKNYLIGLIDGGQTTYLLNQINSNISPGQLKNILIASSPYLSDDVLIAFVNKTSLPNGIVKDVLIANSPLRASVKSAIQNRTSPFPSGIMNNINAVQNGISPMDILLGKISEAQSIRDLSVDELIRQYLYDTTLTNGLDSVQLALKRYGVNLEDKCKLAAAQITAKDYAGATATLDTIRILNGGTLDNSCKLLDLLMRLQQSTNGYYSIKTDPAFASDSVTVSQMASDQNVEAYIGAQAMMKAIFLVSYQEPIDPVPHNSARIAQPTNNISNSELGKIFPNPNNGTMSFNYEIPVGSKGILLLYDISGKQVDSFVLKEGLNTEQISEENLGGGIYFYRFIIDDEQINSGKVVIVK